MRAAEIWTWPSSRLSARGEWTAAVRGEGRLAEACVQVLCRGQRAGKLKVCAEIRLEEG